jgi:hypothetical protein
MPNITEIWVRAATDFITLLFGMTVELLANGIGHHQELRMRM